MNCDICQAGYDKRMIVLSFQRDGKSVVVENVPALVCEVCGDTLLSESTVRNIEELLDQEPQDTAPLYKLPQKSAPVR